MPNSDSDSLSNSATQSQSDYGTLVKFLLEPLVDDPQSLKIDCEELSDGDKVWVRVAFDQEDKGTVFGRGGRNLKAIETLLNTSAVEKNTKIHLDVYGHREEAPSSRGDYSSSSFSRGRSSDARRGPSAASTSQRPRPKKPAPQLRQPEA
jgi:hypothetical protein